MTIQFDLIQTTGLAVLVYMLGRYIKSKVAVFQKYFIPAPVIGGLICSILIFIGKSTGLFTIEMTNTLQDFFMNLFFTGTGFTCSLAVLKKSGKLGAKLAVGAVIFLFVQNLVGVGLCQVFGINKLLGIAMGSISMSGGVGSGASFGQTPNAVANMSAIIEKNGPAPTAWFVLPVVTVIFINITNPLIITFFINCFK